MQAMPRMGHLAACVLNGSYRFNRKVIKITAFIPKRSGTRSVSVSPDMQRLVGQSNMVAITEGKAAPPARTFLEDVKATGVWDTPMIVPEMFHEKFSDPEFQDEAGSLGKVILLMLPLFGVPMVLMKRDQIKQVQGVIESQQEEQEQIKAKILASKTAIMSLKAKVESLENAPVEAISAADEPAQSSEIMQSTGVLASPFEEASDADTTAQSSHAAEVLTAQGVSDAEESAQGPVKYDIGASVEVFSNSFKLWCPGKVVDIENLSEQTLLILEFTWPTGELATKKLPQESQDLRIKK